MKTKKRVYKPKFETLSNHFEKLKKKFVDKGMTFREIELNTGIPEDILVILFSDKQNVVSELSKLFEFFKIKIKAEHRVFNIYRFEDDGIQIRIYRKIHPKAWIYYDRRTQEYYNFKYKNAKFIETVELNKEVIVSEIDTLLKEYLKRNR